MIIGKTRAFGFTGVTSRFEALQTFGFFLGTQFVPGGVTVAQDVWCRVTLTYDNEQNLFRTQFYNIASGTLLRQETGTPSTRPIEDSRSFLVSGVYRVDEGEVTTQQYDDIVLFNRVLSEEEITLIDAGAYEGEGPGGPAPAPIEALPTFPAVRPVDYDPNLFWQPGEFDWGLDFVATGVGRWNQQLIAMGHGKLFYEALT